MSIVLDNPSSFFYDLLQHSSKEHKITLPQDVEVYLLHMLVDSLSNSTRFDLCNSLSLRYLEAAQTRDASSFKQIGDSCLIILGLFPTHRPEHQSLYYDLGPTSYMGLNQKIYHQLSVFFVQAVDVLLGVHLSLDQKDALDIWHATHNRVARKVLYESNVIPLRGKHT
jgi:hypothetical protein